MSGENQQAVLDLGITNAVEEETLSRLYPWRCYTNNMQTSQDFQSLEEMCTTLGLDQSEVNYALQHYAGIMGGFCIKDRRVWDLASSR